MLGMMPEGGVLGTPEIQFQQQAGTRERQFQRFQPRGGIGVGQFANPTVKAGLLAQAMSRIASNPSSASQGNLVGTNNLNEKLFNELQLALAVKMGLKS